jgi:hypothetical protein
MRHVRRLDQVAHDGARARQQWGSSCSVSRVGSCVGLGLKSGLTAGGLRSG